MKARVVKYTFDRKTGELIDKELTDETKDVYIDGVVKVLCKELGEYISKKAEVINGCTPYNIA
jgi:hypothetical protein